MENLSLYRKYRPHNFENLVGQDIVKKTLINALKSEQVAHAYIFSGPRGTGKTSTARLLAKALNCINLKDNYEPCLDCDFCNEISDGRLIDIIEIDAASNRGIDEIRDLKEKIRFAPSRSKYKVYIIDEVHMLTNQAFNALLKTLEEPPAHAYFVLATTELHKIPETIISRCQSFDFKRISIETIVDRLSFIAKSEKINIDKQALDMIAVHVNGGMRDAIGLMEKLSVNSDVCEKDVQIALGMSGGRFLNDFYTSLVSGDAKGSLIFVSKLHEQGLDIKQFIHDFVNFLRGKMIEYVNAGNLSGASAIVKMIEIFRESQVLFTLNIPSLPLEAAVVKFVSTVKGVNAEISVDNFEKKIVVKAEKKQEKKVQTKKEVKVEIKQETEVKDKVKVEVQDDSRYKGHGIKDAKNGDLSLEKIKTDWIKVMQEIKTPSILRSLKNGQPHTLDGNKLVLKFFSNFHRDLIMNDQAKDSVEKIMKTIFNEIVVLDSVVLEKKETVVVQEPVVQNAPPPEIPPDIKQDLKKDTIKNVEANVDDALNIFGGTVV